MKTVIGLFLSIIVTGSVFAQGISVNFDGAKVVYIDQNHILNKIDNHGNVSSVLSTNVGVSYIHSSEQGNLFVVFQSKQRFGDGYDYLLARAVPTNNTILGIDTNLSSIAWNSSGLCPGVQSDSSNNLYYLAYSSSGGLALNKCVNANGTNIVNLINDNVSISNWLVRSDGTILMGGNTQSTGVNWLRKLTPENNLSSLALLIPGTYVTFLLSFPDDRVYVGFGTSHGSTHIYCGVYKLSVALNFTYALYIGPDYNQYTPEYSVSSIINGHNSTYVIGFERSEGSCIEKCVKTDNGRTIVLVNYGGNKTVVQYYPTPPEIIEPTLIDSPTLIEKISNFLLIAGTKNGVNKLILYNPATSNEVSLLNEDIEVYHLISLYDGYVWLDGLKFNGNQHVVGKIQITNNPALRGAVKSVGQFQEMATLSGKPTDLVGVVACPILAPTGVTATDGTYSNLVRISWSVSMDATSYQIWRYTNSYADLSSQLGTSTTTNYDDSTATPGTLYYYWVKATDGSNVSSFSSSDTGYCGSTPPEPDGTLSLPLAGDFDGDRLADPAVYSQTTGNWKIKLSSSGYSLLNLTGFLGGSGYTALAADFDGDRLADPTIYGETNGYWFVKLSSCGYTETVLAETLGGGYIPVLADFDGDRLADPTVYNTNGTWKIKLSSSSYSVLTLTGFLGGSGYTALAGDFDGDRLADPAVYETATGTWLLKLSSGNYSVLTLTGFLGGSGYTALAADFDGDRLADPAVKSESGNEWIVMLSSAGYTPVHVTLQFE